MNPYFQASDIGRPDIQAAFENGSTFIPWRSDHHGQQWYKLLPPSHPTIRGVSGPEVNAEIIDADELDEVETVEAEDEAEAEPTEEEIAEVEVASAGHDDRAARVGHRISRRISRGGTVARRREEESQSGAVKCAAYTLHESPIQC